MADLRISELTQLAGADLASGDFLPVADVSASESKKITVTDFLGKAVTLIADASIPNAKIVFGSASIPGSAIVSGAVTATQLGSGAVTAAKLANESTVDLVTTLPASGAYVGQLALDIDDNKVYCWDGSQWLSFKAAGSVNTIVGDTSGLVNLAISVSGDQVTITTSLDNTSGAAQFLAGPTATSGAATYRQIASGDLPTAGSGGKGAVVVNGSGLTMSGDQIVINNTVAATATRSLVTYDSKGLVIDGGIITSVDLPLATDAAIGGVKIGTGLTVTGTGQVNHTNSVSSGTATKVTYDSQGHITAGSSLTVSDVPDLPTSKITSGTIDHERIGINTIAGSKLGNYSVTTFGSSAPTAQHIGQFFFNPLSRDLFLWDGNVYQPVGISVGEIVFAGTYDASTNLIASVTQDGTAAGFFVGTALNAASAINNRYYFVVSKPGTGTAPAPIVALEPPDILLSTGSTWSKVDVSDTITAQVASNISFTPTGNIASTNVQNAIAEVDSEKLSLTGGTLTGNLGLDTGVSLIFEGSTANAFETTLTVIDPTADQTVSLPNVTGTVITTGDTGTVTSTMILDGTILNADVNASAAIAGTKISPNFGSQTIATTGVFSHALGTAGAPTITFTGDTNTGIYSPGADQLALSTGGAGRLFIDASGNVAISPVNTPSYTKSFNISAVNASIALRANSTGTYSDQGIFFAVDSVNYSQIYNDGVGQLIFRTGSGLSERLRITSTGEVGIGTSSIAARLHIRDGSNINLLGGANGAAFQWTALNDSASAYIDHIQNALTVQFQTGGIERVRIDSGGRLLVGTSSARQIGAGINGNFQVESAGITISSITSNINNSEPAYLMLGKSRGTAIGSSTVVNSGDRLGEIRFAGADGTDMLSYGASIQAAVDGTPGTDSMPGRIVLSTTAVGAATPTERLRITSAGVLQIADAGNITVGTTTGTKIGTATTQKIGFYNATPVVQPTAVANATTAVDVITQLNDLLAKLRTLGIIAT